MNRLALTACLLLAAMLAAPETAPPQAAAAATAAAAADTTTFDYWLARCRTTTERGTRAQFDKKKDEAGVLFAQGVAAGRRAVVLAPDNADGHFELAVALGSLALHRGGREKIRLSKELKSEVERALAIDPAMDSAHHVLARWHRGVAELSLFERTAAKVIYGGAPTGATMDAALEHFEKAIALNPNYANHHLEYGRTLLKLGLKDKARGEFEKALACPNTSPFDPDYKAEAQQLMAKTR